MRMLLTIAIAFGLLFFGCVAQQPTPQPAPQPQLNESNVPPVVEENETGFPEEIPLPPPEENETPPVRAPGKEGEFCGGIAGFQCEEGLICALDGSYPDAGGTCQPKSNFAGEGEMCGGSLKQCEPGLQCITSGGYNQIGSCTAPAAPDEFHICPSQRGDACTADYNPVCGRMVGADPEVAGYREYGNACTACSKSSNAIGYYEGTCESRGK